MGVLCHDGVMASAAVDHAHAHERLHRASSDAAIDAAIGMLRARGERVTTARRAVLEVLAGTSDHLSADRVAALLEPTHPGVHRATVYRTLDVLADLGIVSHRHAGAEATVYHFAATTDGHEHLHAHCRECGTVIVIAVDALDAASARIARDTGFRLDASQSTLVGVCAECAAPATGARFALGATSRTRPPR